MPFWSAGTRIGHCFRLFNLSYAHRVLTLLSDGLNTGSPHIVAEELAKMKQKVRRLMWLNPLLKTAG